MKTKVLHICQMIGGIDIYMRNIISSSNQDFEFVIVHGVGETQENDELINTRIAHIYQVDIQRELNPIRDLKALIDVIRIVKAEKPDVIHCHSAKGGFLGRLAGFVTGVRTLYTPHAFSYLSTSNGFRKKLYLLFERIAVLNSYLLACSESEQTMGIETVGYDKSKSLVWHNAIIDASTQVENKTSPNSTEENYICYMARPSYQKNPEFLLSVIMRVHKRLPDLKFHLLGVGYHAPDIGVLKKGIKKYGLKNEISIYPWLPHKQCLEHIANAKLYFTVSRYEGLPLTVLEAMSLGKAIIASDVVGNKDCVSNEENGYLLPFDADIFADKIIELLTNELRRKQFEEKSKAIFREQFMIENQIDKLNNIYRQAN